MISPNDVFNQLSHDELIRDIDSNELQERFHIDDQLADEVIDLARDYWLDCVCESDLLY
jgi:hypothetical protein